MSKPKSASTKAVLTVSVTVASALASASPPILLTEAAPEPDTST